MRQGKVILAALAITVLVAGMAQAEVYVEAYIGGNISTNETDPVEINVNPLFPNVLSVSPNYPNNVNIKLQGGCKIGTWFVKEGALGFNYPNWMKYLGFYLDFNYHQITFPRQIGSQRIYVTFSNIPAGFVYYKFIGTGYAATLAFMFAFRYGFLPTEKVPFGRLQPYVAVGPAVVFSALKPTLKMFPAYSLPVILFSSQEIEASCNSSVNVALAAELGVRWKTAKRISFDASVKYRFFEPHYEYNFFADGYSHTLKVDPIFRMISFQVGMAYHF